MAISDQILQILEPKITPPSIDLLDRETELSPNKIRMPESTGYATQLGRKAPLIRI